MPLQPVWSRALRITDLDILLPIKTCISLVYGYVALACFWLKLAEVKLVLAVEILVKKNA